MKPPSPSLDSMLQNQPMPGSSKDVDAERAGRKNQLQLKKRPYIKQRPLNSMFTRALFKHLLQTKNVWKQDIIEVLKSLFKKSRSNVRQKAGISLDISAKIYRSLHNEANLKKQKELSKRMALSEFEEEVECDDQNENDDQEASINTASNAFPPKKVANLDKLECDEKKAPSEAVNTRSESDDQKNSSIDISVKVCRSIENKEHLEEQNESPSRKVVPELQDNDKDVSTNIRSNNINLNKVVANQDQYTYDENLHPSVPSDFDSDDDYITIEYDGKYGSSEAFNSPSKPDNKDDSSDSDHEDIVLLSDDQDALPECVEEDFYADVSSGAESEDDQVQANGINASEEDDDEGALAEIYNRDTLMKADNGDALMKAHDDDAKEEADDKNASQEPLSDDDYIIFSYYK